MEQTDAEFYERARTAGDSSLRDPIGRCLPQIHVFAGLGLGARRGDGEVAMTAFLSSQ